MFLMTLETSPKDVGVLFIIIIIAILKAAFTISMECFFLGTLRFVWKVRCVILGYKVEVNVIIWDSFLLEYLLEQYTKLEFGIGNVNNKITILENFHCPISMLPKHGLKVAAV